MISYSSRREIRDSLRTYSGKMKPINCPQMNRFTYM